MVLEVENLEKEYRAGGSFFRKTRVVKAVNGVSFTLRKGQTLGVVGVKAGRANPPSAGCF